MGETNYLYVSDWGNKLIWCNFCSLQFFTLKQLPNSQWIYSID